MQTPAGYSPKELLAGSTGLLWTATNTVEDVHVIDVCIIRGLVGIEVLMHIPVGEPLGTHVVEVVGGLKLTPVLNQFLVAAFQDGFAQGI